LRSLLLKAFRALRPEGRHLRDPGQKQRDEDRTYALIASNVILLLLAFACFHFKLQHGISPQVKARFLEWDGIAIGAYIANEFWPLKLWRRFIAMMPGSQPHGAGKGLGLALWAPVLLNAYVVGYLTYKTGGPSNSPYGQILIAMLIVGQQMKNIQPARPNATTGEFFINAIKEFWIFAVIAAIFYAALLYKQETHPVDATTAPAWLVVGVTALIFATSSFANYLTRAIRQDD
jgi:hypothetical protein